MNVKEITSLLTSIYEEFSDETRRTSQELWALFTIAKAKLQEQGVNKFKNISPQQYKTVCIKLEDALSHECSCSTVGCTVKRSTIALPAYISGNVIDSLRVMSLLGGKTIDYVDESRYDDYQQDDMYKGKPLYSIVNNKLILWNSNADYLQLRALWVDNTKLNDIQTCEPEVAECLDYYSEDIGLTVEQVYDVFSLVFRDLNISQQVIEDSTNDINTEIK